MTVARDFNDKLIVVKGTKVYVRTTNGGVKIGYLSANHYPTYDVIVDDVVIPAYRIKDVAIVNEKVEINS